MNKSKEFDEKLKGAESNLDDMAMSKTGANSDERHSDPGEPSEPEVRYAPVMDAPVIANDGYREADN